jgi:hypothetical protein
MPPLTGWKYLHKAPVAGMLLGIFLLLLYFSNSDQKFLPVLDHANLIFHEAGHPIFRLFGETAGFLGGTLGQLFFPTVVSLSFWNRKEPIGFCVGTTWFFQNFFNIARYMADARAQSLPLLGGGIHDWNHLFSAWGVLRLDTKIAGLVETVGFLGVAGSGVWLIWMWWFQMADVENSWEKGG